MRLLVVSGLFLLMQDLTLNSVEYSVSVPRQHQWHRFEVVI